MMTPPRLDNYYAVHLPFFNIHVKPLKLKTKMDSLWQANQSVYALTDR